MLSSARGFERAVRKWRQKRGLPVSDPWTPELDKREVHKRACYVCQRLLGCLAIVNLRVTTFDGTCAACEHHNLPSCHVSLNPLAKEMPALCEPCSKAGKS